MFSPKISFNDHIVAALSTVFVLLVILLWRTFIYDKSTSRMLINLGIVFTLHLRAKGGVVPRLISYLALLVWR